MNSLLKTGDDQEGEGAEWHPRPSPARGQPPGDGHRQLCQGTPVKIMSLENSKSIHNQSCNDEIKHVMP